MMNMDWCKCWRTTWEFDHMADGKGYCKHCGNPIAFFFIPRNGEKK